MDSKQEIKWGFIGCGEVTEKKSGPAFSKIPGSSVVAVMSRLNRMPTGITFPAGTSMLRNCLTTQR